MRYVYLDQNHWISLAKAAVGHPEGKRYSDALDMASWGVERGLVRFPLSAIHYQETLPIRNTRQRRDLADVMARLSRFTTISPPEAVLPAELDLALADAFDRPPPTPLRLFGIGVRFAFNTDKLQYQPPPALALTPYQRQMLLGVAHNVMEYSMLAGPQTAGQVLELNRAAHRVFGERYAAAEAAISSKIKTESPTPSQLRDWLTAFELIDILDHINAAVERAAIGPQESEFLHTKEGMSALLQWLPSRATVFELRVLRHENYQTRWQPNDLNDVAALGVAIPYCDVVATERQWVHLAKRAGLDHRYNTVLLADLADLPQALV